jgi:MFS family permease
MLPCLYAVALLAGLATGLYNPLISVFLEQGGASTSLIGANASTFFAGVILGAPLVARLLGRAGIRRTLTLGLLLTAGAAALFPWQSGPLGWFVVRGAMGLGMAFVMVGGQTALNHVAPTEHRALVNGLWGLCFGVGLMTGPLLGPWLYVISPALAFVGGAALLALGSVLLALGLPSLRAVPERPGLGLLRRVTLPLHAVLAYGLAEASLICMYPVFLLHQNLGPEQGGLALAAFVIGGILGTLPAAHLGDRLGHRRILAVCVAIGVVTTALLMTLTDTRLALACAVLAGASLGPVFPLALAMLGATLTRAELAAGSALFTTAFSLGSIAGPWLSAIAMIELGEHHLFTPAILVFTLLLARLAVAGNSRRVGSVMAERP